MHIGKAVQSAAHMHCATDGEGVYSQISDDKKIQSTAFLAGVSPHCG